MRMLWLMVGPIVCSVAARAVDTEPPPLKGAKPLTVSTPDWKPVEDEPLPPGAIQRLGYARAWHGIEGGLVATADGKHLVAGFADRRIRIWEAESGKLVGCSKQLAHPIKTLVVSPDGKTIAAASANSIHLLEAAKLDGTPRTLQGHQNEVQTIALTWDGKLLLSCGEDRIVHLWNVVAGKQIREFNTDIGKSITSVVFTRDNQSFLTCGGGMGILWKTGNGECVRIFKELKYPGVLHPLPDGKTLAAITFYEGTYFWDLNSAELKKHLPANSGYGAFSPDGRWLAIAHSDAADTTIGLFDVKQAKAIMRITGNRTGTHLVAISPDSKRLSTYGRDHCLRRWDLTKGKEIDPPNGHQDSVKGVTFTADGKQIISCSADGSVRFWNPDTGRELRRLTVKGACFQALALSPDGKLLALSSPATQGELIEPEKEALHLYLWDLASNRQRDSFYLPDAWVNELRFMPDGGELLVANWNGVRLLDIKTGKDRLSIANARRRLEAAIVSPDGKFIVSLTDEPRERQFARIAYFESDKGKEVMGRSFKSGRFSALAYSPDGKYLAVAGNDDHRNDGNLSLWESPTDKVVRTFATKRFDHYKLAYSPDGRLLAAVDSDGMSIFETATGQQRWRFTGGHIETITRMAFSPDSLRLVTGGDDTLVYLWDLTGSHGRGKQAPLESRDLDSAWAILADLDGEPAGKAIARLAAFPREAIPYLTKRLVTIADAERRRVEALVEDLDSDSFKVRDRAAKELENLGDAATPALMRAQATSKSVEVLTKLEQLLKKIGPCDDPATHAVPRRTIRAIEVLEHAATPEALELLKALQERGRSRLEHDEADKAVKRLNKRKSP